jgi:HK97 family phage major capsid protein
MPTELVSDPKLVDPALLKSLAAQAITELQKEWQQRDNEKAENLLKKFADELNAFKRQVSLQWPTFSLPGSEPSGDAKKDFSLSRASYAIGTKDWTRAGVEREVFIATRAMTTGVDSAGGFIVPPQVMTAIIEPLRAESICFSLGARDIGGMPFSPVSFPKQTSDVAAQWIAENAASTLSQPAIGQMNLRPRQLVARTELSMMLLNAAVPAVDGVIQNSMRTQFALAIDNAILQGTGASGQPTGIVNQIGVLSSTLATPTYDQGMDIIAAVRNANALKGKPGWALSPQKLNAIAKMPDSASTQPLQRRVLADGIADTLWGFKYGFTTQLASSGANAAIFGNWLSAFLMRFGGIELKASDVSDTAMANNSMQIRMVMYADIGIEQPASFCTASA